MRQNHELLKEVHIMLVKYLQGIVAFSVGRQNWKTLFLSSKCLHANWTLIFACVHAQTHVHVHTYTGNINDK